MITCVKYNNNLSQEWDTFIDNSNTPFFFFKRLFLKYHSDRFIDHSLVFFYKEKIIATFPATVNENEIVSHGGLTFGGIISSKEVTASLAKEIVSCLKNYYLGLGLKKITIKSIPYIFNEVPAQEVLYFYWVNGFKLIRRDLSTIIEFNKRLSISKLRKRMISRGKKNELIVESSENFSDFVNFMSQVLSKHDTKPVHNAEELDFLSNHFPENIKLSIIKKDSELIAALLFFEFEAVAHAQYIGVNELGKEVGALDFLIEESINSYATKGFKYFSFGISTEKDGTYLNNGLISQKEGFGARSIPLDFYEVYLND